MAAPPSKTLQTLDGQWKLNKDSSDDFTSILAIQGIGMVIRKAASVASIHQTITQPDAHHIEAAQSVVASKFPGTTEKYVLNWEWQSNEDPLFGNVQGRCRWIDASEAINLGIGEGAWIEDDSEGKLIYAEGKAEDGKWEAKHLWGFEMVGDERKHTRRAWVKNDRGRELRVKMVYDFEG